MSLKEIIQLKDKKVVYVLEENDSTYIYHIYHILYITYRILLNSFFRYKKHLRHLGLNKLISDFSKKKSLKSILDMLVFICLQMSAIHDVKNG